jgi:hypothetical protein
MSVIPDFSSALAAAAFILVTASPAFAGDGDAWIVSKFSGEVWLAGSDVQQASLKQEDVLKPGDTVRTGRGGRVLLKRGNEAILIAPNSVVGVPAQNKDGMSTTILQQAGSILLDVEKRDVKHFEVETPYMAAVVKGTQFRVTIEAGKTSVEVVRGQVEVADFRSGQIAQVMAGQQATAFAAGKAGLSLQGSGNFAPIEQGKPRAPSIAPVLVPRGRLSAPRNAASTKPSQSGSTNVVKPGATRIASPIGEVRLNVDRATGGVARDPSASTSGGRNSDNKGTAWQSNPNANANQGGNGNANGNGGGNAGGSSSGPGMAATVGGGNGNGNAYAGANGNGRGNGNGGGRGRN